MKPRKLTDEAKAECERVARIRLVLPSDKELAARYQVSVHTIERLMVEIRQRIRNPEVRTSVVSCGPDSANIAG